MPAAKKSPAATLFAPAERATAESVAASSRAFAGAPLLASMLEAFPCLSLVLNTQRQVVGANRLALAALGLESADAVLGRRPGEILACVHAEEAPSGCGTGSHCEYCGAVNAILECVSTGQSASRECRLLTRGDADGGALDVRVDATFVRAKCRQFVVVALTDISASKRRKVLERVFCHDLINTAGGIQGLAELLLDGLDPGGELGYLADLHELSKEMVEEVKHHGQMMAAERGELRLAVGPVAVPELVTEVGATYRNHLVARGKLLRTENACPHEIRTDRTLLRRALGNLVKNALEATAEGGEVVLEARGRDDGGADFRVHNPGVMPEWVQQQVFQRSFSTKASSGRGIGTYSVKLFVERYLKGRVAFRSVEQGGTAFTISLPPSLPAPDNH